MGNRFEKISSHLFESNDSSKYYFEKEGQSVAIKQDSNKILLYYIDSQNLVQLKNLTFDHEIDDELISVRKLGEETSVCVANKEGNITKFSTNNKTQSYINSMPGEIRAIACHPTSDHIVMVTDRELTIVETNFVLPIPFPISIVTIHDAEIIFLEQ